MLIRLRGIILIVTGFILFNLRYVLLSGFIKSGYVPGAIKYMFIGALVISMTGLIEVISGHPFHQVATKWDSMPALRKLFLGLAITLVSIPLIILVVAAFM